MFKFYKKEVSCKKTVDQKSAMEEDTKMNILSNGLVRRLLNTQEKLGAKQGAEVIDQYAQELRNSNFSKEQTIRIICNGIKGYEGRKKKRAASGRLLRSTASGSKQTRIKTKLLGKSTWFKKSGSSSKSMYEDGNKAKQSRQEGAAQKGAHRHKISSVVEHTKEGELARRMRELMKRLAPMLGFSIKIVERTGKSLRSMFPLNNLWQGAKCGRTDCTTCE